MDVNDNFTQSVHQAQMDRIAELEADNERWKDWHSRFTDDYLELRLLRAEKAEAHAADCKRLVTSCEDDIDAERMKRREAEACVERLWQLPHVCHRAEQAESELAALKGRRCETCAVNNDCEIQHAAQAGDLFYCAAWLLMNVAARADEGSE